MHDTGRIPPGRSIGSNATHTLLNLRGHTTNRNTLIASSLFALLNVAAFSAQASPKLDVQQVLSTVDDGGAACGVVNARMTYLDSHGQKRVFEYKKFADSCNEGN